MQRKIRRLEDQLKAAEEKADLLQQRVAEDVAAPPPTLAGTGSTVEREELRLLKVQYSEKCSVADDLLKQLAESEEQVSILAIARQPRLLFRFRRTCTHNGRLGESFPTVCSICLDACLDVCLDVCLYTYPITL